MAITKKSLGPKAVVFPTPVFVVGTYDKLGRPNVMTAAWGGICCSSPPAVCVSLRKATYSYRNILEKKAFTVNIPSEELMKEADFFGLTSGRDVDKFSAAGIKPVRSDLVDAPYIQEFPLTLECKLVNFTDLGLHTQFVGEVMDVKADERIMEKGKLSIEKIKPLVFDPEAGRYYALGKYVGKAFKTGEIFSMPRDKME
ncbi:Ferric-chelate reductase (NAD(P)H) [uncultured archaeon]|nr:Ferric-chelate reductase (NAD(P)H) [uncultured archaeon]